MVKDMELRDYFATHCMAIAMDRAPHLKDYELKALFWERGGLMREEIGAALAYRYADALLKQRDKRREY